jgi:hypothetical protein
MRNSSFFLEDMREALTRMIVLYHQRDVAGGAA